MSAPTTVRRVVSGGQTGVDRAAWAAARALGLEVGGWGPAGRWAEDGAVPADVPGLLETAGADPAERTALNVRDSDATLVFTRGAPAGGTALTVEEAAALGRPLRVIDVDADSPDEIVAGLRAWLVGVHPEVLNVAGPRESEAPGLGAVVEQLLLAALR